ncbi:MAG: glycosyltransferase family 4 protein [Alphaproteobacteria bacterium]|nr:glycosyltransferase family 4 protein [Alphaproteobacteria bacterium]
MHSTPHIALFMTYGGSLKIWQDAGILRREMSLYQALCARGAKISIVSYADSSDRDYFSEEFAQAGITLLTRPDCLPMRLYAKTIGWVHEEVLSGANIFKTNQVFGADEAVRAGRFCSKPVVTRMGFHRLSYRPGEIISQKDAQKQMEREGPIFRDSRHIIAPTESIRRNLGVLYGIEPEKISVVPNFVDVSKIPFSERNVSELNKFLIVGRLTDQKNIGALIAALTPEQSLTVIGEGEQRDVLQRMARDLHKNVSWLGRQDHTEVLKAMADHDLFILPSRYEGMPKVVIEAMASGIPVLVSDAPGNRDVVRHGENGFLCGLSADSLAGSIRSIKENREEIPRIIRQARKDAETLYSLETIANQEIGLYQTLMLGEKKA